MDAGGLWRFDGRTVTASSWSGSKVSAAILDTKADKKWDTIVVYERGLAQKAESDQWLRSGEFRSDLGFEGFRKKFEK